jgi:propanediol dehydratase small subunit
VTVEAMREGRLAWEDLRATPETLRQQAAVAEAVGRTALADNLRRAAELAAIASDTILEIYTALRPHRSNEAELEACAARLEEAGAPLSAAFVREASDVYARRGLLRGPRAPGSSLANEAGERRAGQYK